MNRYWFRPDEYAALYNCSRYTPKEWHSFGMENKIIGGVYMAIGFMYEVLYFPCLYTMAGKKFMRLSCYKMMFYLGVIDMLCIFVNSVVDGYYSWHGYVFCDSPDMMYVTGAVSTGLWCSACMACMLLATNRVLDLLRPQWMERLFGGRRTLLWLLAPTAYGLYFITLTPPLIFSSAYDGAFFDPFAGTPVADKELYTSWPHTINNFVVIVVLVSAYTCVCAFVLCKFRLMNAGGSRPTTNRHGMSGFQKSIIIQATMICMLILIAATVYVRMQFFETAGYMVVVGQITWQSSHGGAVFIYLFVNKSMRNEIWATFCFKRAHQVSTAERHQRSTKSHGTSSCDDSRGQLF